MDKANAPLFRWGLQPWARRPWGLQPWARRVVLAGIALVLGFAMGPREALAKPRTLLQDLEARGVSESEAAVLTTSTCLALSRVKGAEVLCGDDLRTLLRFGQLSSTFNACEGEACFEQVTKALKARYVVSGTVSELGAVFVLNLSLFDARRTKVLKRTEVHAVSLEKLQRQIPEGVSDLWPKRRSD